MPGIPGSTVCAAPVPPGFSLAWTHPTPPLETIALSPQGLIIGLITTDGKMAVGVAADGSTVWSHSAGGASNLILTDGEGYAAACDMLNPLNTRITFYRADNGVQIARQTLDTAIWSVAAAPTGALLAAGTEDKSVTLFHLSEQISTTRFYTSGIPVSLAFSPTGSCLMLGRWDQSGSEVRDLQGSLKWAQRQANTARVMVVVGGTGEDFAAIASNNRQNAHPVVGLYSRQGQLRWIRDLGPNAEDAHALVLSAAEITVISYTELISRGRELLPQRRIVAISDNGSQMWSWGGPLFTPELISATPDDDGMVVYDGDRSLYRLDKDGRIVAHDRLSGLLVFYAPSADNSKLLLYTQDGQLSLIDVN